MTTQKGVLTHAHCKMFYIPIGGDSCLFNNKLTSFITHLKRRLSKAIAHFKNAGIAKGASGVCDDWWTDLSNKNYWFLQHKDYQIVKCKREGNGNEGNNNMFKAPGESSVDKEDKLSSCRILCKINTF